MLNTLSKNRAPLIALFIFVLGNGFFSTYIASVLISHQESSIYIGLMTTSLYAGLVIGAFHIERIIASITHIRAYAAFASMISVVALLHPMWFNVFFWLVLRFITGLATAGVFVVIESWLLCQSTPKNRGQMLALYMVTFYAAQALGQLILNIHNSSEYFFFALIAVSCSLSVIPLTTTKSKTPIYEEPSTLNAFSLIKKCGSGFMASFVSGCVLGALYALLPSTSYQAFKHHELISWTMFCLIAGGMALQYPIGKWSDLVARRLVLITISLIGAVISVVLFFSISHIAVSLILIALLGAVTFSIYPVSISHACDSLDPHEIIAGTQTLLLTYSIGAMTGPFVAGIFMFYTPQGLMLFISIMLLALTMFLSVRRVIKEEVAQEEPFVGYPQTTPIIAQVDPRADDQIEANG